MRAKDHLIVSLIFFAVLAFEVVVFSSIMSHPYMTGLCFFLGAVGGYNLGAAIGMKLRKNKNEDDERQS